MQQWADRVFTGDTLEQYVAVNSVALGRCDAIKQLLDLNYEELFKEQLDGLEESLRDISTGA